MQTQGGENETGFEMQIAHCVLAQSRKSTITAFHAKHMIPVHRYDPEMQKKKKMVLLK